MREITIKELTELLCAELHLNYYSIIHSLDTMSNGGEKMYPKTPTKCKFPSKTEFYVSDEYETWTDYRIAGNKGRRFYID